MVILEGMKLRTRFKILGSLLILIGLALLYPGVLFYLERTYGDLGSLNVLETYVPWTFHLLLILIVAIFSILILVVWVGLCTENLEPEESKTLTTESKVEASDEGNGTVNGSANGTNNGARAEPDLHQMETPDEPPEPQEIKSISLKPGAPQMKVVNVADEKPEEEAPESWKNNEEWED